MSASSFSITSDKREGEGVDQWIDEEKHEERLRHQRCLTNSVISLSTEIFRGEEFQLFGRIIGERGGSGGGGDGSEEDSTFGMKKRAERKRKILRERERREEQRAAEAKANANAKATVRTKASTSSGSRQVSLLLTPASFPTESLSKSIAESLPR